MKILNTLILSVCLLGSVACRTVPPIDPMTMRPSERCLPGSNADSGK